MQFRLKHTAIIVEALTFDEFIEYGKKTGCPLHEGMPWSFHYRDCEVTHEHDDKYIVTTTEGPHDFWKGDMIVTDPTGLTTVLAPRTFAAAYEVVEGASTGTPADGNAGINTFLPERREMERRYAASGITAGAPLGGAARTLAPLTPFTMEEVVRREVAFDKRLRRDIDTLTKEVKSVPGTRERSLAVTKLQEATMWLGMDLKRIGEENPGLVENPYPNSKDPDSPVIDKTADGLKM